MGRDPIEHHADCNFAIYKNLHLLQMFSWKSFVLNPLTKWWNTLKQSARKSVLDFFVELALKELIVRPAIY